jgi:hypothetical protein
MNQHTLIKGLPRLLSGPEREGEMSRWCTICRPFPPYSLLTTASSLTNEGKRVPMNNVTADMAKKNSQKQSIAQSADENNALQRWYGQIGIAAVAAAVRYQGVAKNPAYAPVAIKS